MRYISFSILLFQAKMACPQILQPVLITPLHFGAIPGNKRWRKQALLFLPLEEKWFSNIVSVSSQSKRMPVCERQKKPIPPYWNSRLFTCRSAPVCWIAPIQNNPGLQITLNRQDHSYRFLQASQFDYIYGWIHKISLGKKRQLI